MVSASAPLPGADPCATSVMRCDELPWAELQPGFEIKLLRVGEDSGTYTVTTRLAPGIQVPTHRHHGPVHAVAGQGMPFPPGVLP